MGRFSGGLGGAALVGATAAVAWPGEASATATSEPLPAGDEMGEMPGGHSGMAGDMDAMHKEGIDQFLANIESPITKGAGATDLEYRVERSEEHTSELQSLMCISYAVFCLQQKKTSITQ